MNQSMKNIKHQLSLTIFVFLLVLMVLLPLSSLSAKQHEEAIGKYTKDSTITEVSLSLGIPSSKLVEHLGLDPDTDRTMTLSDLQIDPDEVERARIGFKKESWRFSGNIVIVGMLVIFLSLSVTGLFVALLSKVVSVSENSGSKGKKVNKASPIDVKSRDTSYNAIVAAITALHLHLQDAEEFGKMTLSWEREPVSVWKTTGKLDMPNRVYRKEKQNQ